MGLLKAELVCPHFYHYYQFRVQSIWDWQPASILHFMPQPHKDYSSAECSQSILVTLLMGCPATVPLISHDSEHDRGLQLWESVLKLKWRFCLLRGHSRVKGMIPLLTVGGYFPRSSLRYAEQVIHPTIRGVRFPQQGLQDYPYTCAFWSPEWRKNEGKMKKKGKWE